MYTGLAGCSVTPDAKTVKHKKRTCCVDRENVGPQKADEEAARNPRGMWSGWSPHYYWWQQTHLHAQRCGVQTPPPPNRRGRPWPTAPSRDGRHGEIIRSKRFQNTLSDEKGKGEQIVSRNNYVTGYEYYSEALPRTSNKNNWQL